MQFQFNVEITNATNAIHLHFCPYTGSKSINWIFCVHVLGAFLHSIDFNLYEACGERRLPSCDLFLSHSCSIHQSLCLSCVHFGCANKPFSRPISIRFILYLSNVHLLSTLINILLGYFIMLWRNVNVFFFSKFSQFYFSLLLVTLLF